MPASARRLMLSIDGYCGSRLRLASTHRAVLAATAALLLRGTRERLAGLVWAVLLQGRRAALSQRSPAHESGTASARGVDPNCPREMGTATFNISVNTRKPSENTPAATRNSVAVGR